MNDENSIARFIDHTCLRPDATNADIEKLCSEAIKYRFHSVCVYPYHIQKCALLLNDSETGICTVAGFPTGNCHTEAKVAEAQKAAEAGADEIDMVMNIAAAKNGDWDYVQDDIARVVESTESEIITKVIIETSYLSDNEIAKACHAVIAAGADFVKTSTGFGPAGATVKLVMLIKEIVGDRIGIKAAGGIRDYKTAIAMLNAGANRLGTSASVDIIKMSSQ